MDKVGVLSEVDNSYEARFGDGGYGAKANSVLAKVRARVVVLQPEPRGRNGARIDVDGGGGRCRAGVVLDGDVGQGGFGRGD